MAILSAEAALSAHFSQFTVVGFYNWRKGYVDIFDVQGNGYVRPFSQGHWGLLGNWGTAASWQQELMLPIVWTSERIDIGQIKYFTLSITSEFEGSISYLVHTSDLGLFEGEESSYLIEEGNVNIPAFYGRYVYVTARVNGNQLRRMTIEANSSTYNIQLQNVDTSTLPGTPGSRTINIGRTASAIQDVKISVRAATPYAVNLYVSDQATSEVLIPVVRGKGAEPTFGLFGIDNEPRDGIIDIECKAMARQAMLGGNVYVLE
jgi:hypothetical protein